MGISDGGRRAKFYRSHLRAGNGWLPARRNAHASRPPCRACCCPRNDSRYRSRFVSMKVSGSVRSATRSSSASKSISLPANVTGHTRAGVAASEQQPADPRERRLHGRNDPLVRCPSPGSMTWLDEEQEKVPSPDVAPQLARGVHYESRSSSSTQLTATWMRGRSSGAEASRAGRPSRIAGCQGARRRRAGRRTGGTLEGQLALVAPLEGACIGNLHLHEVGPGGSGAARHAAAEERSPVTRPRAQAAQAFGYTGHEWVHRGPWRRSCIA